MGRKVTAVENLDLPEVEFYVSGTTRHAKTQLALIESIIFCFISESKALAKKIPPFSTSNGRITVEK